MKNYDFTTFIPAPSENKAIRKMEALMTLASHLTAKELKALEKVITSEPGKVAIAKSFLGLK